MEGKGHKPSRAELKIVQLQPWLEPARLGLITTTSLFFYFTNEIAMATLGWKWENYFLRKKFAKLAVSV